jgi:arylsulfatase A-like enzyme
MEQMPTMQAWREAYAAGRLSGPQKLFFAASKPAEELYDLEADPHEIHNLAGDPAQAARLQAMRAALDRWVRETGDLGAVPEKELIARGLVADKLKEYEQRVKPLPPGQVPKEP